MCVCVCVGGGGNYFYNYYLLTKPRGKFLLKFNLVMFFNSFQRLKKKFLG